MDKINLVNMSDYPRKGLNQGKFLGYEFEEGNEYGAYAVLNFNIKGKDFKCFVNEWKDTAFLYGKEETDPQKVEEHNNSIKKMLVAPAIAIVGRDKVAAALNGINGFKDYITTLQGIVPANNVNLDIFLQYQYKPRKGQERTWLEVPSSIKEGIWCIKHTGEYEQKILHPVDKTNKKALVYESEEGVAHPFTRSGWFLTSNYWNPQGVTTVEAPAKAPAKTTHDVDEYAMESSQFDDDLPF